MWVNDNQTLCVDRNPDTWQLAVTSREGHYCGNVVGQIVEPQQCLVRYFIVFSPERTKHFLLPSDSVRKIETDLQSAHSAENLFSLPAYYHSVTEDLEKRIHAVLDSFSDPNGDFVKTDY